MTPAILWVLLLVIVIAAIAIAIVVARSIKAGRVRTEAARVLAESVLGLSLACRLDGHVYREDDTGYQCATCSSQLDHVEGARYVLNEARRRGDVAAIVNPDQVPLRESGMSTEHPQRTS